jgi:segregation and condensation protein B
VSCVARLSLDERMQLPNGQNRLSRLPYAPFQYAAHMSRLGEQLRRISASGSVKTQFGPASHLLELAVPRVHPIWSWRGSVATKKQLAPTHLGRRSRLEAVLFLSREPLSPRKLAHLANLTDGTEARTLLASLRDRYDKRGCAFQVIQVAAGYQLLSRPEFAAWLRSRPGHTPPIRLSPPALETLAVVAYRQPVLRADVEAIRGVACGDLLRQLMDRGLLRIAGRSEELGRPLWYGTTKRFLQTFGLCNLDQLPWAQQLRRPSAAAQSPGDACPGEEVAHAA